MACAHRAKTKFAEFGNLFSRKEALCGSGSRVSLAPQSGCSLAPCLATGGGVGQAANVMNDRLDLCFVPTTVDFGLQ